jgi:tyrosinase
MLTPQRPPQDPRLALRHRRSVEQLTADELAALRDAVAKMKLLRDDRGLLSFAGIHGWPQFRCQHSGPEGWARWFLPWHRAYLYYFELALQQQNQAARLAWWDWPTTRASGVGVPAAYADAQAGAQDNPLASGPHPDVPNPPANWAAQTSRAPGPPSALPDEQAVEAVLARSDWKDFSTQLEQQLHNPVHGWVGGDMGVVALAAYDPLFWAHHTMVDRLWSLWQGRHASYGPPPDTYSTPVGFGRLTVGDVLDHKRLGYDYAASVQEVAVDAGPPPAHDHRPGS